MDEKLSRWLDGYHRYKTIQRVFLYEDKEKKLQYFLDTTSDVLPLKAITCVLLDENGKIENIFSTNKKLDKNNFVPFYQNYIYINSNEHFTFKISEKMLHILRLPQKPFFRGHVIYSIPNDVTLTKEENEYFKHLTMIIHEILISNPLTSRPVIQENGIKRVLDTLSSHVYITDPYTDDILYINKTIQKQYPDKKIIGQKCWQIFKPNQEGRCPSCPIPHLLKNPNDIVTVEEYSVLDQHLYKNEDYLIELSNHRLAHVLSSTDISCLSQEKMDAAFDPQTGIHIRKVGKQATRELISKAKEERKSITIALIQIEYNMNKNIIDRIKKTMKQGDLIFRYNATQIIVSYYDTKQSIILQDLIELLDDLRANYNTDAYFGLYMVEPSCELSLEDIIVNADEKMYLARTRSNTRKVYQPLENKDVTKEDFEYNEKLLYDALSKSTDDYIFVCNLKTKTFKYTPEMVKEFELPGEILENAARVFATRIHPDDKHEFINANQEVSDLRTDSHIVEYRALNKNKEYVWLRCQGHVEYDENKEPAIFAGFISNLGKKNYRDNLTGLYNKFELQKQVSESKGKYSMIILNVADFRKINQVYNRDFGDAVLRIIAQRLQTLLYNEAAIFKLDGDQFGILYQSTSEEDIKALYKKIQDYFKGEQYYQQKTFPCNFYASAVISPRDGTDYQELYKKSEFALEYSRNKKSHPITIFDSKNLTEITHYLNLMRTLKRSIENNFDKFFLVYQPKVSVNTHELVGFEALCRWKHPDFPKVHPGIFIPVLEDNGDIIELGAFVFEEATKQLKAWLSINPKIRMSINISYIQLIEEDFMSKICQIVDKYQVPYEQIVLELTETTISKNIDHLVEIIKDLREKGFKIAMDDFGKGYSSLSLLRDEPLDIIKIDQAFVRNIQDDNFNSTFVKVMIELCHQIGLQVVIEGVETQAELDVLEKFNPDFIQGYYTGRPSTIEQCTKMLLDEVAAKSK